MFRAIIALSPGTPALLFSLSLSVLPLLGWDPSPNAASLVSFFCPRGGPAAVIDKIVGLVSVEWRIIGLSVKDDRVKG